MTQPLELGLASARRLAAPSSQGSSAALVGRLRAEARPPVRGNRIDVRRRRRAWLCG